MSNDCERQRGEVEDALARLAVARIMLDTQVVLRLRQACQRDPRLMALLNPALEEADLVRAALVQAQGVIGEIWRRDYDR